MVNINNLKTSWDQAYKDKSLNSQDIKNIKKEIFKNGDFSAEEKEFLNQKLNELGNSEDKNQLEGLLKESIGESNFNPVMNLGISDGIKTTKKIENKQKAIIDNSIKVDSLMTSSAQLIQKGKKNTAKGSIKETIEISKNIIDDLKYLEENTSPEDLGTLNNLKTAKISAKLNIAVAQLMGNKVVDSSKTLYTSAKKSGDLPKNEKYNISKDDLKYLKENKNTSESANYLLKHYGTTLKTVNNHFKSVNEHKAKIKQQEEQQKIAKDLESDIKNLNSLSPVETIKKSKEIISKLTKNFPDNKEVITGVKLQMAGALLQSKKYNEADTLLTEISENTGNKDVKDQVEFMKATNLLSQKKTSAALKALGKLTTSSNNGVSKAAREIIVSIELKYVEGIAGMADHNISVLNNAFENKTPQDYSDLINPMTSIKLAFTDHYPRLLEINSSNISDLGNIKHNSKMLSIAMEKSGNTISELSKMSVYEIKGAAKITKSAAEKVKRALRMPDAKKIAKADLNNFSWDKGNLYIKPDYLDTEFDVAAKWIGKQVKTARAYDEVLMSSSSRLDRFVGYSSAFVLDSLSSANSFVNTTIKDAHEFYNQESDTWYGNAGNWVGGKLTSGGEILATTFTAPATVLDHNVSDEERSQALKTTTLIIGTMGIIKAGAPAWKSVGGGISKVGSKITERAVQSSTLVALGDTALIQGTKKAITGTAEALTKQRSLIGNKINPTNPTIQITTTESTIASKMTIAQKSQKMVDKVREGLQKVPVVRKVVKSPQQIITARNAVSQKIEKGFFDLVGKHQAKLEKQGFKVPKNMAEFNKMVISDPMKAKGLVTKSLLEESTVKSSLSKIAGGSKDSFKKIQDYMVKNPEKFYDDFGSLLTEHFSAGLSSNQLSKAGFEYFSHYTGKDSISKILSSGKVLEQKWDLMTGPMANLTDDLLAGKFIAKPTELIKRLKSTLTETRTWGFRGNKPLGIDDLTKMDRTVASLNTSKTPEAVFNTLIPKSRIGSPKDWKRISDITPGAKNLGTMRNGIELFPKDLSSSIISQAEKKTLIKGIEYQGTIPSEIINAISVSIGTPIAAGAIYTWEDLMSIVDNLVIPEKIEIEHTVKEEVEPIFELDIE